MCNAQFSVPDVILNLRRDSKDGEESSKRIPISSEDSSVVPTVCQKADKSLPQNDVCGIRCARANVQCRMCNAQFSVPDVILKLRRDSKDGEESSERIPIYSEDSSVVPTVCQKADKSLPKNDVCGK
jgi:hypothetical protein